LDERVVHVDTMAEGPDPIPELQPVTTAVLPVRSNAAVTSSAVAFGPKGPRGTDRVPSFDCERAGKALASADAIPVETKFGA
jgi:hypothetical protein